MWTDLKSEVAAVIKANGLRAITGDILQAQLFNIIDKIGASYGLLGVASVGTDPGIQDGNVAYFATSVGVYPNFGLTITEAGLYLFLKTGSTWTSEVLYLTPTSTHWVEQERIVVPDLPLGAQLTIEIMKDINGMVFFHCYGRGYDPEGDNTIQYILPGVYRPQTADTVLLFWGNVYGGDGLYAKSTEFYDDSVARPIPELPGFTFRTNTRGSRAINISGTYYAGTSF